MYKKCFRVFFFVALTLLTDCSQSAGQPAGGKTADGRRDAFQRENIRGGSSAGNHSLRSDRIPCPSGQEAISRLEKNIK